MSTWSVRGLLVDAIRNVTGGRVRSVLLAVFTAGAIGALVFIELSTTDELLTFQEGLTDSGGNVFIATSEQGLASEQCGALTSMEGVIGTAGIQAGPALETTIAPGTLFGTAEVTIGALGLFSSGPSVPAADVTDGWVIGQAAASELGISQGMWLGIDGSTPRRVGAVIDTGARNPRIGRWLMAVRPPVGSITECWVEFAAGVTTGRQETVSAVFSGTTDVVVVPWIRLDEFSRDPIAEFAGRPQSSAWIVAGLLIGMMAWLVTWFRRSQIGLYRAVGTGPSALMILGAVELGIPIVSGALIGSLWATAIWTAATAGHPSADQIAVATRTAVSTVLIAIAIGPMLWPLTARGSIAEQLKDQ